MSELPVPETLADATAMLKRYSRIAGQLAGVEALRTQMIGQANAVADKAAGPLIGKLDAMKVALEPWWKKAGEDLAKGKKSVQLGGCKIGYRSSPARLAYGFDDDEAAIAALKKTLFYNQTTKFTVSLDRKATLKLLGTEGKTAEVLKALGFKTDQAETFILERVEQDATISK